MKVENFHSYNKTVIGFNFGSHKDLSTFKSDIHLGQVDKSSCQPHWSQYMYTTLNKFSIIYENVYVLLVEKWT